MAKETKADGPAPDVAALQTENERLREQTVASEARQSQMLDMLAGMQEQLDAVQSRHADIAPKLAERDARQAELDAELDAIIRDNPDFPAVQVFERRALIGADASSEIRLHDEAGVLEDPQGTRRRWKLRWFNLSKEGRSSQAEAEGYVKVAWSELRSDESLGVLERKDEYVRKGDRGSEVLYKTLLSFYDHKKKRDALRMNGLLTSESRLRDHLSNAVAGQAGVVGDNADQAGSAVHNDFSLTIKQGQRESVTL
jgi:hypothetical protein